MLFRSVSQSRYVGLHIHGIMTMDEEQEKQLQEIWGYGFVFIGYKCNSETIGYITKYINKEDKAHPNYKPIIRNSLGTGARYLESNKAKLDKANGTYTTKTGHKVAIPEYYRTKMWTEEERENKWIEKLESGIRWIGGIKTNEKNRNEVERVIAKNRIKNKRLGYKSKAELIGIAEQERRRRIMLQELRMTKETTPTIVTGKQIGRAHV